MTKVFLSYNNIISSLGFTSDAVVSNIEKEISGISRIEDSQRFPKPFYGSAISDVELHSAFQQLNVKKKYSRLEKMMILSLSKVINESHITLNERVGLIISTTKGNIDLLEDSQPFSRDRTYLSQLGNTIQEFFNFKNEVIILSNACVSGLLSVAVAKRYIKEGIYDHVFIVSGDLLSKFVLSGFQSFNALSSEPCKPYDKDRTGINLGEVSASVLVTSKIDDLPKEAVMILGDASCNDANHISGPSRTGEGLFRSIQGALKESSIEANAIDYISAHGTATAFNDEMEAIAFNRSGLKNVPLNSLKGYFGHTLGASGLIETIIGMHSLQRNTLFASLGSHQLGVSKPLNIIQKTKKQNLNILLKTASGFGGCNTAVLFKKVS